MGVAVVLGSSSSSSSSSNSNNNNNIYYLSNFTATFVFYHLPFIMLFTVHVCYNGLTCKRLHSNH